MSEIIPVPHYPQSDAGQCLPACARMVLAYLGINRSEVEIGQILGTGTIGTPSFAILKLTELNLKVNYQEWSIPLVLSALAEQKPFIAFVRTGFLDYWLEDFAHAVVVVGAVEAEHFWVHDPAKESSPLAVSWDGFLAAWAEFGYRGATLTRE